MFAKGRFGLITGHTHLEQLSQEHNSGDKPYILFQLKPFNIHFYGDLNAWEHFRRLRNVVKSPLTFALKDLKNNNCNNSKKKKTLSDISLVRISQTTVACRHFFKQKHPKKEAKTG